MSGEGGSRTTEKESIYNWVVGSEVRECRKTEQLVTMENERREATNKNRE